MSSLKIAILTPDKRDHDRDYNNPIVCFGTAPQALLEGFVMLGQEVEIHVISCTQQTVTAPEKLALNIWFYSLYVPKWGWLRSGYLGCALAVRHKLREIKPDLVHAQGTERDCAVSAVLSPYPRLLTLHGNLRLIRKKIGFRRFSATWFQSFIEGVVVPRFAGVVCITNYTRKAVEHETPRTWVIPNAVDPSFLTIGEKRLDEIKQSEAFYDSGLQSPSFKLTPIILVVANIDERKNQNAFIRALDSLTSSMEFEVRFFGRCGKDDYSVEFQIMVAERDWCHFGGMIGRGELKTEFARATLLALPTHEDNCPMVVLEAQAAGLPVMASNVGGIPDLIEDRKTGILTDPSDAASMRDAVSLLLRDQTLRFALAKRSHAHATGTYHPKVIAAKHLRAYSELLTQKAESLRKQKVTCVTK